MTRMDYTVVALRLFAVWIWILVASQLPSVLYSLTQAFTLGSIPQMWPNFGSVMGLALIILVLIAFGVWRSARAIAGRIWLGLPPEEEAAVHALTGGELQQILISLLGVWFVVKAVSRVAMQLGAALAAFQPVAGGLTSAGAIGLFVGSAVQMAFGLVLIVGVRRVGEVLRRVRGFGAD